jgi:hypothetical protein
MISDNVLQYNDEEVLRFNVSDEEVEAAAEPAAMSYTYQTSAYNRCCR